LTFHLYAHLSVYHFQSYRSHHRGRPQPIHGLGYQDGTGVLAISEPNFSEEDDTVDEAPSIVDEVLAKDNTPTYSEGSAGILGLRISRWESGWSSWLFGGFPSRRPGFDYRPGYPTKEKEAKTT